MPDREIPISLVVRSLDQGLLVAEPLLFAELNCCDRKLPRLRSTVRELAGKAAEQTPLFAMHRRELPSEASVEQVEVTLDPPKRRLEWTEPLNLRFHIVRWRHAGDAHLAFVPALNIEIIAAKEPELRRLVPEQIVAHLRRSKIAESLYELALTQRIENVHIEPLSLSVHIKKPKAAEQKEQEEIEKKPVIEQVGIVLGTTPHRPAYEVQSLVEQLADALVGRRPRSVLLVGPSGVGKTAIVHDLVRRRESLKLGSTPFWATSGSRLIAGMSGFGMWQQRCQRLCKEAGRDGAVLYLGNLIELMEVGRGGAGGQGIAGFLRPYLGRGTMLAIAECTPEQLPLIEREDPHLLEVFHQLRVEEPSPAAGRRILESYARAAGASESPRPDGWLDTLDRLHRRYATYSANPGRPVRFLEDLLKDLPAGQSLGTRDVIAAFSRETGLPLFMLDPSTPLDLSAAHQWFAGRVIGQERAVDLVTDLLATVKAALTPPRRPIASLLFIGPTGVGKTEMAKALAEYFFGDRNRLTRFDMSEFADPAALERLIGGSFGSAGLLTAKVREQPFSVILFDEFEKACYGFFDLLLQVLGEGRLTDAAGRIGDFSNAIIVMTSNLGAEAFGRGTFGLTKRDGYPDPERHFTDEVRSFLTPAELDACRRVLPAFASLFQILEIPAFSAKQAADALDQLAVSMRQNLKVDYERGVIEQVHRLFSRFMPYYGFPGRASSFTSDLFDRACRGKRGPLTATIVIDRFTKLTGVPELFLRNDVPLKYEGVVEELRRRVIGQDRACRTAGGVITTFKAGLNDPNRPLGVLLFCGPTGVGKTELAKTISDYLFGQGEQQDRLVRLDMSEYAGPGAVERLLGPSEGQPSDLIKRLRHQPFTVVLLDEIEKAAAEVFDVLLSVFDEGRLTDRYGRLTTFQSAIIIMTSNLGADRMEAFGLSSNPPASYDSEAAAFFRPEFFNRIDAVVTFDPLDSDAIRQIALAQLQRLGRREGLERAEIRLEWSERVIDLVCSEGFDRRYGARPLQRTIETRIVTPLARYLVDHPQLRTTLVKIDLDASGRVSFAPGAG